MNMKKNISDEIYNLIVFIYCVRVGDYAHFVSLLQMKVFH